MMHDRGLAQLVGYSTNTNFKSQFSVNIEYAANLGRLVVEELRQEVKRFVEWTVQLLEIDHIKSKYDSLNVMFKRPGLEELGFDGKFIDGDDQGTVWVYIRDTVNDVRDLLETVAHEMVHAKQFCDKKLSRIFKRQADGEVVGCYSWSPGAKVFMSEECEAEYDNLPWEIEANKFQSHIVDCYETFLLDTRKSTLLFQPVPL